MKINFLKPLFACIMVILVLSCSPETDTIVLGGTDESSEEETDTNTENPEQDTEEDENSNPSSGFAGEVEFFNIDLVDKNPILVNDAGNNLVYLMDKKGEIIFDWNINDGNLGNDCFIEDSGKLLAMVESENPLIQLGGHGGKVELLDKDGNVEWEFTYSSEDYILHHDAERLPNGNVLLMVWEKISANDAFSNGYQQEINIYPDAIIEVNPENNQIVWEWHMWDHIVQDIDENLPNYGNVLENQHLIDINYNQKDNGDVSHANGISYDASKDIIYLSVNFYHEIWAIDHSTTTQQAASHEGGNYGGGGDLIYRFGNPTAYKNMDAPRLFHNNHHPNFQGDNKFFVFGNGTDISQSTVYELEVPEEFLDSNNAYNDITILWSFTDPELFSARVSGAVVLPNGNILITEGDFGIWEVTREKEIVWKFSGNGFYWRTYSYTINQLQSYGIL